MSAGIFIALVCVLTLGLSVLLRNLTSCSGKGTLMPASLLFVGVPVLSSSALAGLIGRDLAILFSATFVAASTLFLLWPDKRSNRERHYFAVVLVTLVAMGLVFAQIGDSGLNGIWHSAPAISALMISVGLLTNTKRAIAFIQSSLLILLAFLLVSALFYFLFPESYLGISSNPRYMGLFSHSNSMGTISAAMGTLAVWQFRGGLRVVAIAVASLSVLMSDQRSALIALLVGVTFGLVLQTSRTQLGHLGKALIGPLIVASGFVLIWSGAFEDLVGKRVESVEYRRQILVWSWNILPEILPSGIGPSTFYELTTGLSFSGGFAHPHNSWMTYLVFGGVLGGLSWILLTASALIRSIRIKEIAIFAVVTSALLLGMAEAPTYPDVNLFLVPTSVLALTMWISPWLSQGSPEPLRFQRARLERKSRRFSDYHPVAGEESGSDAQ